MLLDKVLGVEGAIVLAYAGERAYWNDTGVPHRIQK